MCRILCGVDQASVPFPGLSTVPTDNHEAKDPTSWPWLVWLSGLGVVPESKRSRFDSPLGHLPGLWVWSLVGTKGNQSMFPSHIEVSPSPFSSL